jgi:flagellar biosynthesis regulator FlaF
MSRLETELRAKLQTTIELMLAGAAADYAAYASIVARYRVLKELTDFADDLRKDDEPGDPED